MPHCAPSSPSLPQNDTPAEQAARAAQLTQSRTVYQWTTALPVLPEVPLAATMPANEEPTLTWWLLLLDIGVTIARNKIAEKVEAAERGELVYTEIMHAADEALCALIEAEIAAQLAKIVPPSGAGFWNEVKADLAYGAEALAGELEVARLKDHAAKLFQLVQLDEADLAAFGSTQPRSLETYRAVFDTIPVPAVAWCFQDDLEFARMRVAGPNCMLIEAIDALPANFPVTAAQYAGVVASDTLATALAEGRLFVCDYAELSLLQPGTFQGAAKFVYRPLALFALPPGADCLVPVAIQCGQDPATNPIFTPSLKADEQWGWAIAKTIVQVADGNYHELFVHLARTHLVIEAVAVASRRQLSDQHPLWALLVPHFEGTLFINNAAASSLIVAGGPIDHIFGGTIASSQLTAAQARLSFDFAAGILPAELAARGVADPAVLPDYPYRDDALLVWQAIHGWVKDYLALYYDGDAAVAADTELAAWCVALAGDGRLKGFAAPTGLSELADACTMIVFTASAQHAAVNFPQKDVMDFAPSVTGAGWEAAPLAREGHDRARWLSYMPPQGLAMEQLETLYLLGSLHYRPLGTYLSRDFPYPAWFTDPRVIAPEGPLASFQAALAGVEARIVARNAERRVAYPYLQPSLIPSSINI